MNTVSYAAFVGIDWADEEHAVCVLAPDGAVLERCDLRQDAAALDEWAARLRATFLGQTLAVCLEASRGPLMYALMKYEQLVLHPINPKQLAKYRQAFAPSGAKDDPSDAELLARFLREHHQRLRAWRPDDALTRSLRLLVEDRRRWVEERKAAGNRLLQRLKEAYPLAVELGGERMHAKWLLQLLAKFPTERELRRASPQQLAKYLPKLRRASDDAAIDPRLARIRQAPKLVTDEAVLQQSELAVKHLVAQLQQLNATIDEYKRKIAELVDKHPAREVVASFRGAGEALVPRLIAALGSDRQRYASAAELQAYAGVAPVTVQSGRSRQVRMRRACPHFLRQTFHEFARCSLKQSRWARAYYEMLRAKGHGFHSAVRALAFKWIRILFHCWKKMQAYDESLYLKQLRQKNSPLLAYLPTPPPQPDTA